MDYTINGIDYLVLNNKETDKSKINNNSVEYTILKNWLIFKKHPINQKQIDKYSLKMEYILNQKLYNYKYDDYDENNQKMNILNINLNDIQNLKIPEKYYRYKNLLNINYDDV